jgi:hypothetical protein
MSADIEKMTVMDGRIVQSRPKYAVEKGALSLTNAPFNAIAATQSQMTFNVYVPSENVFVDRKVQWSVGCYMTFLVQRVTPSTQAALAWSGGGEVVAALGSDVALAPFPINSLCSTLSATINDTTTVINSQDVLKEVLRLTDYKKNRLVRTTPTMLDKYASYNDSSSGAPLATPNGPLGGFQSGPDYDNVQNGAYPNVYWTLPNGTVQSSSSTGTYTVPAGVTGAAAVVTFANGQPTCTTAPTTATQAIPVYVYWEATEPIVLSPFVFSDHCEWDTGLFGINNIQLVANLLPASQLRTFRCQVNGGRQIVPGSLNFNSSVSNGQVFSAATLNVQFLTPSLDVPLPPKSVVPYMEFPRYISQPTGVTLAPGASTQIQSQTITLPTIPDLLLIYVKPQGGYTVPNLGLAGSASPALAADYSQADWYLSLGNGVSSINFRPINVNFDNFSGLLSSVTTQELYTMSVKNGLEEDWASWSGSSKSGIPLHYSSGTSTVGTVNVVSRYPGTQMPTVGSVLVLKPSQDITLQSGQAPSLVGNFTLQFNLTVTNQSDYSVSPTLYVITANSGFFESIRGSSRIIKGVLSEQDIISAPLAPMVTRSELDRLVGAGGFKSLANVAHRAMDTYSKTRPAPAGGRAHHEMAEPEEMASGGRHHGGRSAAPRGLAQRLM